MRYDLGQVVPCDAGGVVVIFVGVELSAGVGPSGGGEEQEGWWPSRRWRGAAGEVAGGEGENGRRREEGGEGR